MLGAGALLGAHRRLSCARTAADRRVHAWIRVLLAYFSRAGENYHYGGRTHLEVGNTEVAAEIISACISADVYKIEAAIRIRRATRRRSTATYANRTMRPVLRLPANYRISKPTTPCCSAARYGTYGRQ